MALLPGWLTGAGIFNNDPPKSPWGKGEGDGGKNEGDGNGGPRNPWSFPPEGKRPRPGGGGPLDELLKRARSGGGGSGIPGLPASGALWGWIAVGLILLWIAFTSAHMIGPQERGVVRFLGSYSSTLGPGLQFTLPAPLNTVEKIDVQKIRTISFPENSRENLMLTGDQNIVNLAYSVRWDIASAPDYAFQIAKPDDTVKAIAESAMRAVIATVTLNEAIGEGRGRIEGRVQALMQQILDEYKSGIRIQGVAIKEAGAPEQVDDAFKAVTAAQQEAQANKNNANAYAQQVIAAAQGQAAEFDKIYEQYKAAPEVTRRRLYYETMEAVLAKSDKVIVEAPGVTPYLPLPNLRNAPPAQQQGGAR